MSGPTTDLPLAVYGTLRQPTMRRQLGVDGALTPLGPCTLAGRLYDLGAYPALVLFPPGTVPVTAELFALTDPAALAALDRYEGYLPGNPAGSLFRRVKVRLTEPARSAWVYTYARPVPGDALVASGDWLDR